MLLDPNVSEEAKEHSQQVINELEGSQDVQEVKDGYAAEEGKDEVRVNAGYKASLKSKCIFFSTCSINFDISANQTQTYPRRRRTTRVLSLKRRAPFETPILTS